MNKMVTAYCVKCRKKVEVKNPKKKKTKRGTMMYQGECKYCGTKVSVFGKIK